MVGTHDVQNVLVNSIHPFQSILVNSIHPGQFTHPGQIGPRATGDITDGSTVTGVLVYSHFDVCYMDNKVQAKDVQRSTLEVKQTKMTHWAH